MARNFRLNIPSFFSVKKGHTMNIDIPFLMDIFNIYSASAKEHDMYKFIREWLEKRAIPFETSSIGNIYSVKNETPLLSAHMDTVMRDKKIFNERPIILDTMLGTRKTIIRAQKPRIIGADDKCGIYIILKMLEENPKLNFLFSVQEEVGAVGADDFINSVNISHIPYGIVLDRGHSGDIICAGNNYGTKEFEDALSAVGESFSYKPALGVFSDCDRLNEKISCANLSVGYYNAHSSQEFCVLEEMENTMKYLRAILSEVTGTYKAPERKIYTHNASVPLFPYCPITGELDKEKLYFLEVNNSWISIDVIKEIVRDFDLITKERAKKLYSQEI